jgi:hypothetical protein
MKYILSFEELVEKITIPVEVGDVIYTGRFKNKKTIIKEIGNDEDGMPIINKKKVVNFKITPPKKKKKISNPEK